MNKNCFYKLSTKEKLDIIGKVVDQLVKTTSACFSLSDSEKNTVVEYTFSGIHKIMDDRYSHTRDKHSMKEITIIESEIQ